MTKVVVAHDYVSQRGGAERVALTLLRTFPGAPLVTSVYDAEQTFPGFRAHEVRTSPLQAVPAFRRDPRLALPLLAPVWSRTRVTRADADVVVASSSGWAHGLATDPGVGLVVYCHNPARWLYQSDEYFAGRRVGAKAISTFGSALRRWDGSHARRATRYLANSSSVARRIRDAYGIEAEVLPPPVSVDTAGPMDPVPGLEPGFLLTVARGRGYKNTSVVEEAVAGLPGERLVVVGSATADEPAASSAVVRLGRVSDARLRWLYANARALVSVSFEDFGLTPLEANAFGTPAVLLRAGGFLDTLAEGVSGVFVDAPEVGAVRSAVRSLPDLDADRIRLHAATYSEAAFRARLHEVVEDVAAGRSSRERVIDLRDSARTVRLPGQSSAAASSPVAGA
ncbi:glycosyltransferase involved in cell wall biosynthesis [Motilibacter rhizosphaerae]|uniref:Glycosyltransferase involved in cell wall biosynthesis n=1 Tax=Motilibacter rhizosphaerae TaxID=598652 RepID=A0A4Q7NQW1_9ACTN|nr:glycosyltransferase [Motilibacter rhizosphaerae]RZS87416.1 glycosyltransferase involved in cell wall biosynthesis [Motilibacter rhizosphaerae]